MDRSTAIFVVKDIMEYDGYYVDLVDLIKRKNETQYNLKIKGSNNKLSKDIIEQIAQAHNLKFKEDNGFLIF